MDQFQNKIHCRIWSRGTKCDGRFGHLDHIFHDRCLVSVPETISLPVITQKQPLHCLSATFTVGKNVCTILREWFLWLWPTNDCFRYHAHPTQLHNQWLLVNYTRVFIIRLWKQTLCMCSTIPYDYSFPTFRWRLTSAFAVSRWSTSSAWPFSHATYSGVAPVYEGRNGIAHVKMNMQMNQCGVCRYCAHT